MSEADREDYYERAAIMEFEGKMPRETAEKLAFRAWANRKEEIDDKGKRTTQDASTRKA